MSSYSRCLRDLSVQRLELYTACILSQYHWDKAFHFPGTFDFLVKTITDSVRLGVVYLNIVLSTGSGFLFCEIYLQSTAHITIFLFILFSCFLTNPLSPVLHRRSLILAPGFPVNLEALLSKTFFSRPLK